MIFDNIKMLSHTEKRGKKSWKKAIDAAFSHAKTIDEVPWITITVSYDEIKLLYPAIEKFDKTRDAYDPAKDDLKILQGEVESFFD